MADTSRTRTIVALSFSVAALGVTLVILVAKQFQTFSAEKSEAVLQLFLEWLETSAYSTWLRESLSVWVFPINLTVHTLSMGILAGVSVVLALRILGFAPRTPLTELRRFMPLFWISFWVAVVTGINLVIAYPTKALTNPVFYVKLALIALSLVIVHCLSKQVFGDPRPDEGGTGTNTRALAVISLICWLLVIWAGRALPYTYKRLTYYQGGP